MLEGLEGLPAHQRFIIDYKAGRTADSQRLCGLGFLLDDLRIFVRIQAGCEGFRIKLQLSSKALQLILGESTLVLAGLFFK